MNTIFHNSLYAFVMLHIDVLLTFRKGNDIPYKYFELVLSRLHGNELYASSKKWEFMKDEIDFFGFLVGNNGIQMSP